MAVLGLIPALGMQRQADFCEFDTSLVYIVSFRTATEGFEERPCLRQKLATGKRKIMFFQIYHNPDIKIYQR